MISLHGMDVKDHRDRERGGGGEREDFLFAYFRSVLRCFRRTKFINLRSIDVN